jgi:putative selenium metabolism hydrolase
MESGIDTSQLVAFTQDIIRIPSLSGEEEPVARRIRAEFEALGFDRVTVDANGSVVGILKGDHPGRTLLFDAHTDTVGISPGVPWQHAPFGAEIDQSPGGEAIYGRGGADMKGALAAMIYAAAAVDRSRLHGRVVISASTLEEVLEGVALQAVMEATRPDFVVIGESTDLGLSRGGRGRAEVHLTTVGRPSHSSAPHLGRNAVLDMMRVIAAVESIELPEDPFMGPAILALTDIVSDPYPGYSVIPSRCRVTYDRRLLPGETQASVLGALRADRVNGPKWFPAWVLDEAHPFVQGALAGLRAAGLTPRIGAYRFCTNAAYSAGVAGVPTVGFGPASEGDAHVVDERLAINDLLAAARGYQGIIEATLGF